MKNSKIILPMAILLLLVVASCGKDNGPSEDTSIYECATCSDLPVANVAYDNNSGGIYKGIVIGSSGTIVLNINNDGSEVTAILTLDGDVITLTSTVAWVEGQSYVAPFNGTYNGQNISVTFSVDANGENPVMVTSDIPGHPNAVFTIIKELSSLLVEGFEGTYSSTSGESGTFNILLSRELGKWGGNARENGSNETSDISGTITSDNKLIEDEGGVEVATLEGDEINGEFEDEDGTNSVHGLRTL